MRDFIAGFKSVVSPDLVGFLAGIVVLVIICVAGIAALVEVLAFTWNRVGGPL